jgi:hypothetical protein
MSLRSSASELDKYVLLHVSYLLRVFASSLVSCRSYWSIHRTKDDGSICSRVERDRSLSLGQTGQVNNS